MRKSIIFNRGDGGTLKRVALGFVLAAWVAAPAAGPAAAQATTPAAPAWRPFSEFAHLLGSWSGTSTSGDRIGGRVVRFTMELAGTVLVGRATTLFPAGDGRAEESAEEVAFIAYDRARRAYVATYFFSTGVFGTFDVEFLPGGAVRMTAPSLGNYEAGSRSRLQLLPRADGGLDTVLEIAPAGKDFVPLTTSSLKKK